VNLIDYFPEKFKPLQQQVDIVNDIEKHFKDGKKFVVVSAPTGSGKSFISATLANKAGKCSDFYKSLVESYEIYKPGTFIGYKHGDEVKEEDPFGCFVLTITKTLQDQYTELFDECEDLKGKSNYQCNVDPNFSVETAPCVHLKSLKNDCWKKDICPYYTQRNRAITTNLAALNYSMFFSLPDVVRRRKYIVCDEASELEDVLVKQFTCDINTKVLGASGIKIPQFNDDHGKIPGWLNNVSSQMTEKIEDFKDELKSKPPKTREGSIKLKLVYLSNLQQRLRTVIETWGDCEYLFDVEKDNIKFYPLKVDKLANYLFENGDKIILLSATIIDHKNFTKNLGIKDYGYVEVGSTFDPKNGPIFCSTRVKLNRFSLQKSLPVVADMIQQICDSHKGQKGIIHTHTNEITLYLKSKLRYGRYIFREPGVNNEQILEQHLSSDDDSVIVSPSMTFGVDLKDDLARFQIIVKAPYPPLLNQRVKKLTEMDQKWYTNKMLSQLIQACGRGVRSKDDKCVTYIIDGKISDEILQNKSILPKYFIDRFM
jgi:Rad3-related DNA helicase